MHDFTLWLAATPASQIIQKIEWIIPILQTIHILAIAIVLSSVVMIDLRILGIIHNQTIVQTVGRFMPWIWGGLIVLAISGVPLIIAEPRRTLDANPAFYLKMSMLLIAIVITLVFQLSLRSNQLLLEDKSKRAFMHFCAIATIALWFAIAAAGRWIAYLQAQ